jgi:hypothetical protein
MSGELVDRTYVALVHHPVIDRNQRIVATAITNLDLHDIARASRTFGLAGYFVVTPVEAQRELATRIVGHWTEGAGREHNEKRTDALSLVRVAASIEDVKATIAAETGVAPEVVATGARSRPNVREFADFRARRGEDPRPLLLLFGTGWGLAPSVMDAVDCILAPIRGRSTYNHLSVRSAVAIVLDRLFGEPRV